MSRAGNEAHDAACKAAHGIFMSCVHSIEARIAAGEITRDGDESLSDAIHTEADGSCIYTSDCWILAYGLREADIDDLGGLGGCETTNQVVTRQAYANLASALQGHDFDAAFQVAEDAAAEKEGA